MNIKSLIFSLLFIGPVISYGQQQVNPPVQISYEINLSRDTVLFFIKKNASVKNGTLMFTASAIQKTDTFYFPVIDSNTLFALAIPAVNNTGSLQLKALFYSHLFEIKGTIRKKIKNKNIKAILITDNKRLYNKTLQLQDSVFTLPGLVFQDKATLVFAYEEPEKNGYPNVNIRQTPVAADFKNLIFQADVILKTSAVNAAKDSIPLLPKKIISSADTNKFNKISTLQNVTVTGRTQSKAEKFNEENSSGLFNDANEKVIDCLDNDDIVSYPDCLSFLQTKVAGLSVATDKFGENVLKWRGQQVQAFYIDEIPVDVEQVLSMNVTDIAIIKVYPPPFFGDGGNGSGGAIALYTRVGEYRRADQMPGKWLFEIRGYSPAIHVLNFNENNQPD